MEKMSISIEIASTFEFSVARFEICYRTIRNLLSYTNVVADCFYYLLGGRHRGD